MSDITTTNITSTGTAYAGRARVKYLTFVNTATAGTIVLRDGGASGTVLMTVATPPVAGMNEVNIPQNGVLFETDVHATLTNVTSLTTFVG